MGHARHRIRAPVLPDGRGVLMNLSRILMLCIVLGYLSWLYMTYIQFVRQGIYMENVIHENMGKSE